MGSATDSLKESTQHGANRLRGKISNVEHLDKRHCAHSITCQSVAVTRKIISLYETDDDWATFASHGHRIRASSQPRHLSVPMRYTFRVRYNEAMLRAAVRAFVLHRSGGKTPLLTVVAVGVLYCGYLIGFGKDRVFAAFVTVTFICLPLWVAFLWRAHLRSTLGRFRLMPTPESTFTVTGDALSVVIDDGAGSTLPWSYFREIWDCGDCWLLLLAPNDFITLPTRGVPDAALNSIRSKIPKYASIAGSSSSSTVAGSSGSSTIEGSSSSSRMRRLLLVAAALLSVSALLGGVGLYRRWKVQSIYERGASSDDDGERQPDKRHLEAIRKLRFIWDPLVEGGGPIVDPYQPYGSAALADDLAPILGTRDEVAVAAFHVEVAAALSWALKHGELEVGRYPLAHLTNAEIERALRRELRGLPPERIAAIVKELPRLDPDGTFPFTHEHLLLIRHLRFGWPHRNMLAVFTTRHWIPVPIVNYKRPFGDMTAFEIDMAEILGLPRPPFNDTPLDQQLSNLYWEIWPALQVFVEHATIATRSS